MTDHSIKLTLLNTLLLCCLQGFLAGAVLANAINLKQAGTQTGKRKSLHEYGPEDVHPEAQENENSAPRKRQTTQPKARNITPSVPKSNEALAPALIPTPKPKVKVTPSTAGSSVAPVVTPTPARVESTAPSTAITRPAPEKVKKADSFRRKLLVSSTVFIL